MREELVRERTAKEAAELAAKEAQSRKRDALAAAEGRALDLVRSRAPYQSHSGKKVATWSLVQLPSSEMHW